MSFGKLKSKMLEALESRTLFAAQVVGFLPDYELGALSGIRFNEITQLNYFSVVPNSSGDLPQTAGNTSNSSTGSNTLDGDLKSVVAAAKKTSTPVWITIGGYGEDAPISTVLDGGQSAWTNFAHSVQLFCDKYALAGVDLDWEPATASTNRINEFGGLIATLHSTLSGLGVSADVLVSPDYGDNGDQYLVPAADVKYLNQVNVESYALANGAGNAPAGSGPGSSQSYLTAWGNYVTASGGLLSSVLYGLPFFGEDDAGNEVGYNTIVSNETGAFNPSADAITDTSGTTYYINSESTLAAKMHYADTNGYGGALLWELGLDDSTTLNGHNTSLLDAVHAQVVADQNNSHVPTSFDFGTPTSPVAPGYTRVSEQTVFSATSGFGWQTAPVGSRDRATSDPLTRDFDYASTTGSTFAVNVPNGAYSVTVKLGDPTTKRDDQGIFFEGSSTAAANVTTNAGQVYTNTFAVPVTDGQLNLTLKDLGGNDPYATIDSLAIAPLVHAHFDFGTPTSPVASGYTGVSDTTAFSLASGFGWQTAPLGSRDRGTSDPLTRDFNFTDSTGATFAANVPNGTYNVTVKIGDPTVKRDDQAIYFEGSSTATASVTTNAGQVYTNTFKVKVSDGQLNVLLKDLGGSDPYATIDSLDINPVLPQFDFGTATSAVAAGYTAVTEATAYSAAAGFGWQTAPLGSRDRGTSDPLTTDFNYTDTHGAVFAVDLPSGTYKVTVQMGDPTVKRDDQGIFFEGSTTAAADVTTNAGQVYTNTFTVAVTDGQLNLLLKDLGGNDPYATIDSLAIAPA